MTGWLIQLIHKSYVQISQPPVQGKNYEMVVKIASRPRPLFTCILESMCYKVRMLLRYTYSDVNKAVTEPRVNKKYEKVQIKAYTQKNEDSIRVNSIYFHLWWNVT